MKIFKILKMHFLISILFVSLISTGHGKDYTVDDINNIIEEFNQLLKHEKDAFPKGDPPPAENTRSSVIFTEIFTDVQRTYERIAEETGLTDLPEQERQSLLDVIQKSPSYVDLLNKCLATQDVAPCDAESPYRTLDGTCNNLLNPRWGSTLTCHERMLPSHYDGISGFRKAVSGNPLPQPRLLSLGVFKNISRPERSLSHMFMFFGQVVSHDISDTPHSRVNSKVAVCCPETSSIYPECSPIQIEPDDPFYSQFEKMCLQFQRRSPCAKCSFDNREQTNAVSVFLDLNFLYGRNEYEANDLKSRDGSGRLESQNSGTGELLPPNKSDDDLFCPIGHTKDCFKGGDSRINQHSMIMALHNLFLREHNRLVGQLSKVNPHWNGDKVYEVARKIFGAVWQNVIYKEYLPLLIGPELMDELNLWDKSLYVYDESVNPSVRSEFAAFAFRLHSFINTKIGSHGCANFDLKDSITNTSTIHMGCTETLLESACQVPSQMFDKYLVNDITEFTNRRLEDPFGSDLASLNIQRGRDHGSPSYPDVIHLWSNGQIKISDFDDLRKIMSTYNVDLLKKYYENVNDIDAWIGMNLENRIPGSPLGGTAAFIIAQQFYALKMGDRFYFENSGKPWSFTPEQIQTISQSSFSKLICDNAHPESMPRNAFLEPSPWNYMPCSQIPSVNLELWKETSERDA